MPSEVALLPNDNATGIRRNAKGHRLDSDERKFAWKVQEHQDSTRLVSKLSKSSGISESDIFDFVDDLCRVCWAVAGETTLGEGALAAATEEVKQLKQKMNECNLDAVKQMAAMRNSTHADNILGDDEVTFHEPLKYLDAPTRELVLRVVGDKVRQLELETAPPSLVKAITSLSAMGPWRPLPGADDSRSELRQQIAEFEDQTQELQDRADALERELENARPAVNEAKSVAAAAERALGEAKEREAALRAQEAALRAQEAQLRAANEVLQKSRDALGEECRRLEEKVAGQSAEIAQLRTESARHQEAIAVAEKEVQQQKEEKGILMKAAEQLRADVSDLTGELSQSREQLAKVKDEMQHAQEIKGRLEQAQAELQAQLLESQRAHNEVAQRATTLESQLKDLQACYNKLDMESKAMREELAKKENTKENTKAAGTQTKLIGKTIDDQVEEIKRLRVMLVELQTKLGELIEKCAKMGSGGDIAEIAESLGLGHLLQKRTVFQRLYEDAMDRVERLEKLRTKIRSEKQRLGVPVEENEPSVLELAEARLSPRRRATAHVSFETPASPAARAPTASQRMSCPAVSTAATSTQRGPVATSTHSLVSRIASGAAPLAASSGGWCSREQAEAHEASPLGRRRVLSDATCSPRDGEVARQPPRLSRAAESLPTLPPPTVGAFRAGTRSVMDLHLSGRPKRSSQSLWM